MPDHVGSAAMSAVHCVRARTKTRSKKSSSGVTVSPSRATAVRRRLRETASVLMRAILTCDTPPMAELPAFTGFPAEAFTWFAGLQADNSKTWFHAHRATYDAA